MTTADIFNVGKQLPGPPGADGAPGKTYTMRKPTLYEQGEFQRWLEQRAHDAVDRSNATEAAKDRRHGIIDAEAALGKYEYDSPRGLEARWLPAGMVKIITITMREQKVDDEIAEYLVKRFLTEIAAEYIEKKNLPPELHAAALASLGLPTEWTPSGENTSSYRPSPTPRSTDRSPNSGDSTTTNSSSSTVSSEAPMG